MTAATRANLCVLYLDFDGVLHPEDAFFHPVRGAYAYVEEHGLPSAPPSIRD